MSLRASKNVGALINKIIGLHDELADIKSELDASAGEASPTQACIYVTAPMSHLDLHVFHVI